MPVSVRQQNLAKKAALMTPEPTAEYEILDPAHTPDLRGEFAGSRVYRRGEKQLVRLTPAQAQFYLDQGGLAPVVVEEPKEPPKVQAHRR